VKRPKLTLDTPPDPIDLSGLTYYQPKKDDTGMRVLRRMYFIVMWTKIVIIFSASMVGVWFALHREGGVPIALAIIGLVMVDIVITRELMRRFARDSR
jgi:hypothetical protein